MLGVAVCVSEGYLKMKRYRIKETRDSSGESWYSVEHQRKMFFLFGPLIWVNAGSPNDGYSGTDVFFTYEAAEKFMESLYHGTSVKIVKEVEVN